MGRSGTFALTLNENLSCQVSQVTEKTPDSIMAAIRVKLSKATCTCFEAGPHIKTTQRDEGWGQQSVGHVVSCTGEKMK